jgi:hypothetical protein
VSKPVVSLAFIVRSADLMRATGTACALAFMGGSSRFAAAAG